MPLSFALSNTCRDMFFRENRRDLIRIIYYVFQLLSLLEMTSRLSLTPRRRLTAYSSSSLLYSAVNNIDDVSYVMERGRRATLEAGSNFFRIIVTFNRIKCSFSWSSHATNECRSSILKERLISQPINLRIGILQKIRSRTLCCILNFPESPPPFPFGTWAAMFLHNFQYIVSQRFSLCKDTHPPRVL